MAGSGCTATAAVLRGVASRARGSGAQHAQLALAQTAGELMGTEGDVPWPAVDGPPLEPLPDGRLVVPPPGSVDGRQLSFT